MKSKPHGAGAWMIRTLALSVTRYAGMLYSASYACSIDVYMHGVTVESPSVTP